MAAFQAAGFSGYEFPARWAGLRDDGPLGLRIVDVNMRDFPKSPGSIALEACFFDLG